MGRRRRGRRGEGYVEQLPSGTWRAIISMGKGLGGKRIRETFSDPSRQVCLDWLAERRLATARGVKSRRSRLTVSQWLHWWLDNQTGSLEPASCRIYRQASVNIDRYLSDKLLTRLCPGDVEEMLKRMSADSKSANQQERAMAVLRIALNEAQRRELLASNPASVVRKPLVQSEEMCPLTVEQCRAFLDAARPDRLYPLFLLLLDAGCRLGEGLGLHWSEVDLAAGTIAIVRILAEERGPGPGRRLKAPKTSKSRRRIQLATSTVAELAALRERMRAEGRDVVRGPVFVTVRGNMWWRSAVYLRFDRARENASLPHFHPHDLRHTCATLLLRAGVNVKVVSERLGHSSVTTTLETYTHVMPDMQAQAAEAMGKILGNSVAIPDNNQLQRNSEQPPEQPSTGSHGDDAITNSNVTEP